MYRNGAKMESVDYLTYTPGYYKNILFASIITQVFLIVDIIMMVLFLFIDAISLFVGISVIILCSGLFLLFCFIYIRYCIRGLKNKITFTKENISGVHFDNSAWNFEWTDFKQVYIMDAGGYTFFIASKHNTSFKERKLSIKSAISKPYIYQNDIISVECVDYRERIEFLLKGVIPIIKEDFYLSTPWNIKQRWFHN